MRPFTLTREQLAALTSLRAEIRLQEGGSTDYRQAGGCCGVIAECVPDVPGLEAFEFTVGCYVTDTDELIYDHVFNRRADAVIIDASADQFAEPGETIRALAPGQPRHGQYRVWTDFDVIDSELTERAVRLLATRADAAEQIRAELAAVGPYVYMTGERGRFRALCERLAGAHPRLDLTGLADYA